MKFQGLTGILPSWKSILLAVLAAVLLILAFPDFEFWFLAWFALVPLMWAVEREKASTAKSFVLGWIFGTVFFFGTCWWLTFAPINYAAFPWPLAYFLLFCVTAITGLFPAIFAGVLSILLRRLGSWAFLAAPFVWVFTEFLRYWLTGNNWNAIGYSQAFVTDGWLGLAAVQVAFIGGIWVSSAYIMLVNWVFAVICFYLAQRLIRSEIGVYSVSLKILVPATIFVLIILPIIVGLLSLALFGEPTSKSKPRQAAKVIAIQPNVPMGGLDSQKRQQLRGRQITLSKNKIWEIRNPRVRLKPGEPVPVDPPEPPKTPLLVILPESPMNFMYSDDGEFQKLINDFAQENNVSVLFNSAEPDATNGKYFNSAVMVNEQGNEVAQYDKIFLLPFGEAVPPPLEGIVPGFVGNFSYGREYDLLPLGEAKAGVMICFESHFGQLSREYVRNGADAIIEMTNDGYLGPTPVLRQHFANAVFRAVETNRPVLRVTNVGITAYIDERGNVLDTLPPYTEGTRVWTVSKSDGSQTFYVKYGDWFAWSCSGITLFLICYGIIKRPNSTTT